MRPPGAKRGAAPFGSAESHELRSWARLRAGGLRPCPLPSPNAFPSRCFRSLSPCAHSNPRSYQAPFSPSPADPKNFPKITKHPAFARPAAPAARAPNGAQPHSAPPKATSFARGPACGGRAAPLPPAFPQCFPFPLLFLPLLPPCNFPQRSQPKNSPAAFHRLRGSVHLWYFVPALMAQARYSCSHSSTRAS